MSIEKRGDSYRVRKMVKGKSYCITFDHKPSSSEVTLALSDKINEQPKKGTKRTFKECAEEFIEVNEGSLKMTTINEYKGKLRRLPDYILDCPVCDITEAMVQRCVSEYATTVGRTGKPKCQKTVQDYRAFITGVLSHYGVKGLDINALGAASEDKYMPTESDIIKLIQYIKDSEIEVPVLISAFASLRQEELLALEMEDIKDGMIHVCKTAYWTKGRPSQKVINLYAKTDHSIRYTAIPKSVEKIIHKKGYIYPYRPNKLRLDFHKACEAVGIPHIEFRVLRSYYASIAHYLGVPDKYIQKNGGWKNDLVLKRIYQKTLSDKQKEQDKKVTDYFASML